MDLLKILEEKLATLVELVKDCQSLKMQCLLKIMRNYKCAFRCWKSLCKVMNSVFKSLSRKRN